MGINFNIISAVARGSDRNWNGSLDRGEATVTGSASNAYGEVSIDRVTSGVAYGGSAIKGIRLDASTARSVAQQMANYDAWVSKDDMYLSPAARAYVDGQAGGAYDNRISASEMTAALEQGGLALTANGIYRSDEVANNDPYRPAPPLVNPNPPYNPTPPVYNPNPPGYNPNPPGYNPNPPGYNPNPPGYNPNPPVYHPAPPVNYPTPPVYNPKPPAINPAPPTINPNPPRLGTVRPQPPTTRPAPPTPTPRPTPPTLQPTPPKPRPVPPTVTPAPQPTSSGNWFTRLFHWF